MINISKFALKIVKEESNRYDIERSVKSDKEAFKIATEVLDICSNAEEVFAIATLDTKCKITGVFEISRGGISSSIVHPREVFKRAILQNAVHIILFHNHPSGDPTPSVEDINITKRLTEAGEIIGIKVADHIIVGDSTEYVSMKGEGYV